MHYTEYVRGTLNPSASAVVDAWTMGKIDGALGRAGIRSLLSGSNAHLRGIVEFQNSHKSAGIGFVQDFRHRLQSFVEDREVLPLGLEGEILVISDYMKESPEIYTVCVKDGKVTYKESHVLWEPEEKRF
ncbi:MAG: hypothetical protein JWR85_4032 [Marmoricola sp.]|jgi:hypothetical protein|nr:hypothetical protein [Marmoricola sp.]